MLVLHVPSPMPELRWICDVIFHHFLGLDYALQPSAEQGFRLCCDDATIELPDVFFATVYRQRNAATPAPTLPLPLWDPASAGLAPALCALGVPVVFGVAGQGASGGGRNLRLPLDIFGTAFYMLTRYEELDSLATDGHGRFPDAAALAVRAGFAHRPIVDEYVEILWAAIGKLCPLLKRAERDGRTLISCDVDLPVDPACASLFRLGKRMAGRGLRQRSLRGLPSLVGSYFAVRRGEYDRDPYLRALAWIMQVNAGAGHRVAFNIIPANTDQAVDLSIDLHDPRLLGLLRTIHAQGHEIGIHPGYNTYHHPVAMGRSVHRLRATLAQLGIEQAELGGRQHYLRWRAHVTPQLWEENHLDYDSTLGYAAQPGFRCGTCREYPMFDLVGRRPLRLRQRPLLSMEPTRYRIAACRARPFETLAYYRQVCRRYHGDFTLLWHNSKFESALERETYQRILFD